MKPNFWIIYGTAVWIITTSIALHGCGQDALNLPPSNASGSCGEWYPESATASEDVYGFEAEKTLPCVVFERARLGDADTFIDLNNIYLTAAYGQADVTSIAFVIGAENCSSCAVLIRDMAENADRIDAAGAVMINVTFCDNTDRTDCDFDLDKAVSTAEGEGWPGDRWWITNDENGYIKSLYRDSFPTVIVGRISDMQVISVDRVPSIETFLTLLDTL